MSRTSLALAAVMLAWPLAAGAATVDAAKDLGIKKVGQRLDSKGLSLYYRSTHFDLRVSQEKKYDKQKQCVAYCSRFVHFFATLAIQADLVNWSRNWTRRDLAIAFPNNSGKRWAGADTVVFSENIDTPKAVQLALANAEAIHETFIDTYGYKLPSPGRRVNLWIYGIHSSGAVRSGNAYKLGSRGVDRPVHLHELFHVYQQSYGLFSFTAALQEAGAQSMQHNQRWSDPWLMVNDLVRFDDSAIYRWSQWPFPMPYVLGDWWDYFNQRVAAERLGRAVKKSDLDQWSRVGMDVLRKRYEWNRATPLNQRPLDLDSQGRRSLASLKAVVQSETGRAPEKAEAFVGEVLDDWWESHILGGDISWNATTQRTTRSSYYLRPVPLTNDYLLRDFEKSHWTGRHSIHPQAWWDYGGYAQGGWNGRYPNGAGPSVAGKLKPGRVHRMSLNSRLELDSTGFPGGDTPSEPKRPGISPYNARFVVIRSGTHASGSVLLRATSRADGYAGHPYGAPRVRLYAFRPTAGHPLGAVWRFERELGDATTYAFPATNRYYLVLVTTRGESAGTVIETGFRPAGGTGAFGGPLARWRAPKSGRKLAARRAGLLPAPVNTVDLGRLQFQPANSRKLRLHRLGFKVEQDPVTPRYEFVRRVRKLRVYLDARPANHRYDTGETIWYDREPIVAANDELHVNLASWGTPLPLTTAAFPGGSSWADIRVEVEFENTLDPREHVDVTLRAEEDEWVSKIFQDLGDSPSLDTGNIKLLLTTNELSQIRVAGVCAGRRGWHTLPWSASGEADAGGTVRLRDDIVQSTDCQRPRFKHYGPSARPELVPRLRLDEVRAKLEETRELVAFRLQQGVEPGGEYPSHEGVPVVPDVQLTDEGEFEYSFFDATAVDCEYENTDPDSAIGLEPGASLAGQGLCPGKPRFFRLPELPAGARLTFALSNMDANALVSTEDGATLGSSDGEPSLIVDIPDGAGGLLLQLGSALPLARVETELEIELGGGEGGTLPELPDDEADAGDLPRNDNERFENATALALGVSDASVLETAWHFLPPGPGGMHALSCAASAGLLGLEIYDAERLLIDTGPCGGGHRLHVWVEPEAFHFLRVRNDGAPSEDPAAEPLDYTLRLERLDAPLPCESVPPSDDTLSAGESLGGHLCGEERVTFGVDVADGEAGRLSLHGGEPLQLECSSADGEPVVADRIAGFTASLSAGSWLCEMRSAVADIDFEVGLELLTPLTCNAGCICGDEPCEEFAGESP